MVVLGVGSCRWSSRSRKAKERRNFCGVRPYLCSPCVPSASFCLGGAGGVIFYHFRSASVCYSFWVGLVTSSLSLASAKSVLISPFSLKDNFAGFRILGWRFFPHWKNTALLPSRLRDPPAHMAPPAGQVFLSHQPFFLCISFSEFDYNVPWFGCLWIYHI